MFFNQGTKHAQHLTKELNSPMGRIKFNQSAPYPAIEEIVDSDFIVMGFALLTILRIR